MVLNFKSFTGIFRLQLIWSILLASHDASLYSQLVQHLLEWWRHGNPPALTALLKLLVARNAPASYEQHAVGWNLPWLVLAGLLLVSPLVMIVIWLSWLSLQQRITALQQVHDKNISQRPIWRTLMKSWNSSMLMTTRMVPVRRQDILDKKEISVVVVDQWVDEHTHWTEKDKKDVNEQCSSLIVPVSWYQEDNLL